MCICVYVYIYTVYIYICIYVYMYICIHIYIYQYMKGCIFPELVINQQGVKCSHCEPMDLQTKVEVAGVGKFCQVVELLGL